MKKIKVILIEHLLPAFLGMNIVLLPFWVIVMIMAIMDKNWEVFKEAMKVYLIFMGAYWFLCGCFCLICPER